MIRRFGRSPEPGRTYKIRRGVYALLPVGRDLLLTIQSQPDPDLQLPGGGIDPGESSVGALYREVFEETGWHIASPRRFGAFRMFTYMPEYDLWAEKICQVYVARPVRCVGLPGEPFHQAVWMDAANAARELDNAGNRHFAGLIANLI